MKNTIFFSAVEDFSGVVFFDSVAFNYNQVSKDRVNLKKHFFCREAEEC